jgi:hypothetical protein
MARTKPAPAAAPSAAHAATDPAPATDAAPAAGSPAAAVHAALAASPGSTIAVIAAAAGTGRPAARAALLAMEKDGTATRVKGTTPGTPDTWTLAETAPAAAGPHAGQPGTDLAGTPGEGAGDKTADSTGDPAPEDAAEAATPAAPAAEAGTHDADDSSHEDALADEPDPALVTDLTGHLGQIRAAADAAGLALAASADLKTALAGLDEICEHATQARRALKAAIGGRKAPAVRPGGLRDKVLAYLNENPDAQCTPHEIHKVLDHSSGAIANALETLVKRGEAEVATEKPRRFRRAAQPAGPAAGTAGADGAEQDGTELAGAA